MEKNWTKRDFSRVLALAGGVAVSRRLLPQAPPVRATPSERTLKIGCATLAWNVSPPSLELFGQAIQEISSLGYWGFETVGPMLEALSADGALARLIEKYELPLKAGYMDVNLTDPSMRKDQIARVQKVAGIIKKHGGSYLVVAPNGRRRPAPFHFPEHKSNIVEALNEYGMAIHDIGLGAGLHQHTGTVVDTKDEVYAVMEAVNTEHMRFAPDVGQLQKAGTDAAKVVKDFAQIIDHMHLKDFSNGKYMGGYCPLGMGVVDLESILNTVEEAGLKPDVIHELDRPPNTPMTAHATAAFGKAYLMRLGYKFRS